MHTANGLIAIYRQADFQAAIGYGTARDLGCTLMECRLYGQHCFRQALYDLLGH
ncbi:hypothetical protein MUN82_04060 [Hymenobacter aerilatus]|uniref:Uncharacterized protein n=1 Tax=Hymenobacter aerilatus TaxID=2932251 RepID=A0A8T9SZA7_9BACT|nr:hypothetical protein [Hymenobacter aerilatus]UOR06274.1 hypothetical protein MUN82_04060 [Hymenobacter aerilatus]